MWLDRHQFGQSLSSERKRLNLQVNEVASAANIKPGTQYLYEQGKRVPNAEYLNKIFEMGFRPDLLLPSIKQDQISFDLQHLIDAFVLVDKECRDQNGRLLDLEHRVKAFIDQISTPTFDAAHQGQR